MSDEKRIEPITTGEVKLNNLKELSELMATKINELVDRVNWILDHFDDLEEEARDAARARDE